jgi:hypothetical protein
MVVGYAVSLFTLLAVAVPTTLVFWRTLLHRFDGSQAVTIGSVVDSLIFLALSLVELVLLGYVTVRDLRRRRLSRAARHIERNSS